MKKKTEMSRLGDVSGMPERKRMWSTHGDARKKTENLCTCKNVESEKKIDVKSCENETKITEKRHDAKKNADGHDADEYDGNRCVGWRSIRSAGNCDARRTSERRYGEHRARQEADARLQ